MLGEIDKNLESRINFNEFIKLVAPKLLDRKSREEIYRLFKVFDQDKTGKVSLKNLFKIANDLYETISEQQLQKIMNEVDKDEDGYIGFEDFYTILSKNLDNPTEGLE